MTAREPAQRVLVHKLLDWNRVERRLCSLPATRRTFPLEMMKEAAEKPPYYCHYMAWRLGTWSSISLFSNFESLLCHAESLPGWRDEVRPFVHSSDFAEYWSLLWQLQVAEHLTNVGTDVRWTKGGSKKPAPDLSAAIDGRQWFVECYALRKSFGILGFLEDILPRMDEDVRTYYDSCLPFSLPKDNERSGFLHEVLSPVQDREGFVRAKAKTETEWPVPLYEHPGSSLRVYLRGDTEHYRPGVVRRQTGEPALYVKSALSETVAAKNCSNGLRDHRPNLLAVNFLLSKDFHTALTLREREEILETAPQLGANIDVLAISEVGIDERLTRERLSVVTTGDGDWAGLDEIATPF